MVDESGEIDTGAMTRQIRRENAEYIGVTPEELEEMDLREIMSCIAERQRDEFIEARWCGELRFRIRRWIATRSESQQLMFTHIDDHD